ncbi:sigma 54-interacting transcriptional regulator [Polyangium sp. y55x31]|uniref:sigma 54-interacting transcriptional regulator n=1 Tax=Polyangium sp. y55x31 TaxID=3042688 RepID=UPI002482F729|nr:sigma 54-interacting transcriptional regulator [Polyangium sp. y55x31]MDI1483280.1 sigma 54-interacting transcriptional regulator [Polyangium sp. y55x31]
MSAESKGFTLTLVQEDGQACVELPRARVLLRGPGRDDAVVELGLDPVVVGSGIECDLVVDDPYVSRRHCQLVMTTRGVVVRDLGSRNGIWVQKIRVVEAVLPPGAGVSLGKLSLTVEAEGAVRVPLSAGEQFGEAVGKSMAMRALFARLQRAAETDEPVLMLGESGTGKELLARAIHQTSPRRGGPFVVFDCGAVAPSLVESELFGHEKGAFSGAQSARVGLLESANGGTLFLDELGELPLDLQPKLLRALESRQVKPVGGNRMRPLDLRVVAATHRDLKARVSSGEFREDLYYRLAVVEVRVPPLRERRDDIPVLVERLLAQRTPPCTLAELPPNTLEMLAGHTWPGNVRELRNTLARLILFRGGEGGSLPGLEGDAKSVTAAPVPLRMPFHEAREVVLEDFERRYAAEHLRAHEGNVSAAARAMGVSRQFLHKLISEHGLKGQSSVR